MNYKSEAISEQNVQSQRNQLPESIQTNQSSVALFMFMSKLKKYHGTVMQSRYWLSRKHPHRLRLAWVRVAQVQATQRPNANKFNASWLWQAIVLSVFNKAPVEGLWCKPKCRANTIHQFLLLLFACFLYFFYHFSFRKDQFIVLILKFGIEDFTDHLSRSTEVPADPHWFVVVVLHAFTRVSLNKQTAGIYKKQIKFKIEVLHGLSLTCIKSWKTIITLWKLTRTYQNLAVSEKSMQLSYSGKKPETWIMWPVMVKSRERKEN